MCVSKLSNFIFKADLKRRNKINSRKFGTKGELTEQLANVLKALWTCKNESDHSTSFKVSPIVKTSQRIFLCKYFACRLL